MKRPMIRSVRRPIKGRLFDIAFDEMDDNEPIDDETTNEATDEVAVETVDEWPMRWTLKQPMVRSVKRPIMKILFFLNDR